MQNKYKTAILPNSSNIGGQNLITQQLYNHYNALLNAKPKIEVINLSQKDLFNIIKNNVLKKQYDDNLLEFKTDIIIRNEDNLKKYINPNPTYEYKILSVNNNFVKYNGVNLTGDSKNSKKNKIIAYQHFNNLKYLYKNLNNINNRKNLYCNTSYYKIVKKRDNNSLDYTSIAHDNQIINSKNTIKIPIIKGNNIEIFINNIYKTMVNNNIINNNKKLLKFTSDLKEKNKKYVKSEDIDNIITQIIQNN